MRESELTQYLKGERDTAWLSAAIQSLEEPALDADLRAAVSLSRDDLIRLCDAHLADGLAPAALETLATAILGSDRLVWDETSLDGELVAEVLWDWSSPDSESGLSSETIALHRKLLLNPPKPKLTSPN
ncbi:MAG TPA: hypothetical protein VJ826_09290 [Candidatus Polarisedimenticolaceae bacterium]|nr:hypothetical protein [Candidatus Polarisedimenticolaceae bacterium]